MKISLQAEQVFTIHGWPVSNSLIAAVLASLTIIAIFWSVGRKIKTKPGSRFSMMIESLCEVVIGQIEEVTHDHSKAVRFFPIITTLFVFILLSNWMGLLPIFGSVTVNTAEGTVPLLRGANADINTTLSLAIISVVATQIYAFRELGVKEQLGKYFSKNPILSFVGILEIVGEFSKMISFSFRLFGNIFAGEVLLIVISSLVPILGPLPFYGLELFVGFIQALVFAMLSLVFLAIATQSHSHGGSHEAEPAEPAHA